MTKSKKQRSISHGPKLKLKGSFDAIIASAEKNTAKRKDVPEGGVKK